MKLLAISWPRPAVKMRAAIARHAIDELLRLCAFYRDRFVCRVHPPAGPGAVLLLESGDLDAAEERLAHLPLVGNEIIQSELIELRPFTAFERLFSDS